MKTALKQISFKVSLTLFIVLGTVSTVFAQGETGTATLSGVPAAGMYDYTLTLHNTGTVPIGTFWYAWVPGEFFLPSSPSSPTTPLGWSASTPSSSGRYSVEYTASSGYALAGGGTLSFGFTSPDTPATLAGNSPAYPGTPIGTSFLYSGGPFSDAGYQFVVQSVPEPSALGFLGACVLGLVLAGRGKLRKWAVALHG